MFLANLARKMSFYVISRLEAAKKWRNLLHWEDVSQPLICQWSLKLRKFFTDLTGLYFESSVLCVHLLFDIFRTCIISALFLQLTGFYVETIRMLMNREATNLWVFLWLYEHSLIVFVDQCFTLLNRLLASTNSVQNFWKINSYFS